jgi:surface antigen
VPEASKTNQFRRLPSRISRWLTYRLTHQRTVNYGVFLINVVLIMLVVIFVVQRPKTGNAVGSSAVPIDSASLVDPIDQLSSADIAVTVSRVANLPEATAVENEAQSVNAELATVPTDSSIAPKPQVVATAFKSNQDIQTYVMQPGDTIASVAAKFGIPSTSITWSNTSAPTNPPAGTKLVIPPISGIVYTVQAGDTPQSLATKYNANLVQLIAYNDAEINGIHAGEQILIPNGQPPSAPTYNFYQAVYGSANGYDFGYCTWYVASQISVPNNWGNASSWAYYAALSGWNVSTTPTVGAIAQTADAAGGEGHVAIVDAVSPDSSQIQYRDMNGLAGWDRVGYSGWVSSTTFQHYLTH